jgi:outer membrane lipopolysaccharide assembly protein LptE/RlpB
MQPVYLATDAQYSDLSKEIFKQLKLSGVQVTKNAAFANSRLVVKDHETERRSQSLDSLARTAEYAYYQSAVVTLRGKTSKDVLPSQTVQVRRVIVNDPNSPVTERAEERIVNEEMTQELATQIVSQLDYWARLISRKR